MAIDGCTVYLVARPPASTEQVRQRMSRQRSRDTGAELALRSRLHAMGLRYRLHIKPIPDLRRSADIVFGQARVAVMVDGCFWHKCPIHATSPKANSEWWASKLDANAERDRETDSRMSAAGWSVIRVWEHEDMGEAADRIRSVVLEHRRSVND